MVESVAGWNGRLKGWCGNYRGGDSVKIRIKKAKRRDCRWGEILAPGKERLFRGDESLKNYFSDDNAAYPQAKAMMNP